MRMQELSAATGIPTATIKYYLREGLLPEGVRTAPNQARYDDAHVQRLKVVRALADTGVGIAGIRKVVEALDSPPSNPNAVLGAAHAATTPQAGSDLDPSKAEDLARRLGWTPGACDEKQLAGLAQALQAVDRAGFEIPGPVMDAYVEGIQAIANAEIANVPQDSAEAAVRYVVLGSTLPEPLLLAMRRVAEQVAATERFGRPEQN